MHQAGDAVADVRLDAFGGQRGEAEFGAHGVGAGGEVGDGVNQGAVEVKGDGFDVCQIHGQRGWGGIVTAGGTG
ncbi:hypothetical protein D3C85_1846360 [compost metagenome]